MILDLTGRTALVTGGGVGIGAAVAAALTDAGARVAITYRSHPPTEEALTALGGPAGRPVAVQLDSADEAAVERSVGEAAAELGGLDIVVNNIGGLVRRATLDTLTLAQWREILTVTSTARSS
ncbi:Glucose 1-dehydrogenase 2 [Barrientosiimonas humi]|nr:Glucose 1-dehydrogenase 2 [Barrientosiimonas humi]